jgi:hypothetical protein
VSLRWATALPGRRTRSALLSGTTTIRVRINVLPWLRRSGRIYLELPAQPPGPVSAAWLTHGRFLAGQVRSGNRTLIYSGPITTPFMEDELQFQFSVQGSLVQRPFPVMLRFEMDED